MRGKALWGGLAALAVVGGGGLAFFLSGGGAAGSATAQAKAAAPIPAATAIAARRDLPYWLEGVGNVKPFNTVAVRPQVDGQLLRVSFAEGQMVKAGEVLAQIDPRSYQAALDQAIARREQNQAQLENARRDLDRLVPLAAKNFVSGQQVDTARARVRQFEAAVKGDSASIDAARIQLGHTTIRAPIDGRAGFRQADPGTVMRGGGFDSSSSGSGGGNTGTASRGGQSGGSSDTVVTITQMQPISVVFTLPQDGLPQILQAAKRGRLPVVVFGRDKAQRLEDGVLDSIDSQVDPANGTVRLKARFTNASGLLWPGQFVTARLGVAVHEGAVTVPAAAVVKSTSGELVFVARADSTVESRPVSTGIADGDLVEILAGVEAGETVVVSGQQRLRPGARIAARPLAPGEKG